MSGTSGAALPCPSESVEQTRLFQWAKMQSAAYPEIGLLFHIPNGGKRYAATAKRLKAEGVKAGVPDLFLPVARGGEHGLFIELKKEHGNKATEKQNEWLDALRKQGYTAAVCYGWYEAARLIYLYLGIEKAV